jgi:hypothetical protein
LRRITGNLGTGTDWDGSTIVATTGRLYTDRRGER